MHVGGLVRVHMFSGEPQLVIDWGHESREVGGLCANLEVGIGTPRKGLFLPSCDCVVSYIEAFSGVFLDSCLEEPNYSSVIALAKRNTIVA